MKRADAILTSDWHIRATKPICRTDDFLSAMWRKVEFVYELAREHDCPIINAGDIGETAQWPNWLLERFLDIINQYGIDMILIAGQHDLPNHNLREIDRSGIGVLYQNDFIASPPRYTLGTNYILMYPFGEEMEAIESLSDSEKMGFWTALETIDRFTGITNAKTSGSQPKAITHTVAVTHQMIIRGAPLWPGQVAPQAVSILKKYGYDLIVSGDNHNTFVERYEGRLLVNPGSLTRHKADQVDHRPCVFLWYAADNEVEQVFLPIEQDVIDRTYIDKVDEKEEIEMAFVERMNRDYDLDLSYEENMRRHFEKNRVHSEVKKKVWEALNESN